MWPWRHTAPRDPADPPVVAPRRQEWTDLPPLQRAAGPHPLVDPPGRFARDLASWRSPAFLAPLGHVVTPGEPSGVVEGIVVARSADAAPPLPVVERPRPRRGAVGRLTAAVQRWAMDAPVDRPVPDTQPLDSGQEFGASRPDRSMPEAALSASGPQLVAPALPLPAPGLTRMVAGADPAQPGPEDAQPGQEATQPGPEANQPGPEAESAGAAVEWSGPEVAQRGAVVEPFRSGTRDGADPAAAGTGAPPPLRLQRTVDSPASPAPPVQPDAVPQRPRMPLAPPARPPAVSAPAQPSDIRPDHRHASAQRATLGTMATPARRLGLGAPIVPVPAAEADTGGPPSRAAAPAVARAVQRFPAAPPATGMATTASPAAQWPPSDDPATGGDSAGVPPEPIDSARTTDAASPDPGADPVVPILGATLPPIAARLVPGEPDPVPAAAGSNPATPRQTTPLTLSRATPGPNPATAGHGPGIGPTPVDNSNPAGPPLIGSHTTRLSTATAAPEAVVPVLGAGWPSSATNPALAGSSPASLPLTVSRTTQPPDPAGPSEASASLQEPATRTAATGDPGWVPVVDRPVAAPMVARLLADRPLQRYSLGTSGPGATSGRSAAPPAETAALQRLGTAPDELLRRAPVPALPTAQLPPAMPALPTPQLPPAVPALPIAQLPPAPAAPQLPPAGPALPTAQLPPAAPAPPEAVSDGWTSVDLPAAGSPDAPVMIAGTAAPATASGAAASVPPPAATAAPEPEELLKTLFDPLYRRLRAELRKDRDRRGLITDLRR